MQAVDVRPRAAERSARPVPERVGELLEGLHDPAAAARFASLLFTGAAVVVLASLWLLPVGADRAAVALTALTALLTAAALPLVPWQRLPDAAVLVPPLIGLVELGVGLGALGGALHAYVLFYALVFLHVGLTRPPGTSLRVAPAAVAAYLVALAGLETTANGFEVAVGVTVSVLMGELLAVVVGRQRATVRGLERLLAVGRALHAETDIEAAARRVSALAQELVGADGGALLLPDHADSTQLRVLGLIGSADRAEVAGVVIDAVDTSVSASAHVFLTGERLFVADVTASRWVDPAHVRMVGMRAGLWLPLRGAQGVAGVLALWWSGPRSAPDDLAERALEVLASEAGTTVERLRTVSELSHDAATDPLTGLRNRRGFLPSLDLLPPDSAIVLLDLDHFKGLNDSWGHDAGDAALVAFAQVLAASVREGDGVCRWGGEEFALVMPAAGTEAARSALQRLRQGWGQVGTPVTFSAGIAGSRRGEPVTATLARADAALYRAKETGRDRWVVDEGPAEAPAPDRSAPASPGRSVPATAAGGTDA